LNWEVASILLTEGQDLGFSQAECAMDFHFFMLKDITGKAINLSKVA
jgi:hypothetical protein